MCLIPVRAIHFRAGLDPCGSLGTQNTLILSNMLLRIKTSSLVIPSPFGNQKVLPEELLFFFLYKSSLLARICLSHTLWHEKQAVASFSGPIKIFSASGLTCALHFLPCNTVGPYILVACLLLELFLSPVFLFPDGWCILLSSFFLNVLYYFIFCHLMLLFFSSCL